ncbi:MAG: hypothetical protein ACYTAF_00410 [Planctomycetota bacterium]|jgi:hypothetical protein
MRFLLCALALLPLQEPESWDARIERLSAKTEAVRGRTFTAAVGHRKGTRVEYARRAVANLRSFYGEDLGAVAGCLRALGLIPEKLNLALAVSSYAGVAVQVYHEDGTIVHPREDERDDLVLNKLATGLLEQHFPAPDVPSTFDARMALASLRQGDAEIVKHMFWHGKKGDEAIKKDYVKELADGAASWEKSDSKLASAVVPRLFVRGNAFPWKRGAVFVESLRARGGWKAVDAAHASPPASTEQVLHPAKYPDEVPTTILTGPFEAAAKEKGFSLRYATTMGELGVLIVLESHEPKKDHAEAAAGWGGDRLLAFEKEGAHLLLWATDWDTEEDALQFQAAMNRVSLRLSDPEGKETNYVVRRGTAVAFLARVPPGLRDGLLEALWKCRRKVTRVESYGKGS